MPVREILTAGHPMLREPTRALRDSELRTPSTRSLIEDLIDTMRACGGAGLAANQIGEPVRICVIEVRSQNPRYPFLPTIPLHVLINPHIEPLTGEKLQSYEGCLSVPGYRGLVLRHTAVEVDYLDAAGAAKTTRAMGMPAIVFQHEVDHLEGRLFLDLIEDPRTLVTTDNYDRWHRDRWLRQLDEAGVPQALLIDV